jgi:transcriptional regulator with XRE-family HTH domain
MDEKGIRQTWLARKVGIHNAHLANIKMGRRTATEETARRLADILNVPFSWLFDTSDDTE